jgi:hypothetical protein
MHWPPTEDEIRTLPRHEHSRLEYKRQWYDFSAKREKAEFVKDVLAMANSTTPDSPGYIIVGIDDEKAGGGLVGVSNPPAAEQMLQLLTSYINPAPDLQVVHLTVDGKLISVLKLAWTPSMPHYANRDFEGVLDTRFVYARRGETIGFLRPPEIEALLRHKGVPAFDTEPLAVGFVEPSSNSWDSKVIARIVNLTDEPIGEISTLWDFRLPAWPAAFGRWRSFHGLSLGPGESAEDAVDPIKQFFVGLEEKVSVRGGIQAGTRWFDVVLRVQFRDRHGFLQQIERRQSISANG